MSTSRRRYEYYAAVGGCNAAVYTMRFKARNAVFCVECSAEIIVAYSNAPGIVRLNLSSFFLGASPAGELGVEADRERLGVGRLASFGLTSIDWRTSARS